MESPKRRYPIHITRDRSVFDDSVYFATVCTKDRKPILAREEAHETLARVWKSADHWLVGRYVVMPDHVHLICAPGQVDAVSLTKWVAYWKSQCSKTWPHPGDKPIWQQQFWDTRVRRNRAEQKWQYVVENPVRHGLVAKTADWPFQGEIHRLR
ncbi:MAG TPA: transposase [Fimbriimonadaceae bacterium]|nr:transposase [Fimbriimonadaceae bacterium]